MWTQIQQTVQCKPQEFFSITWVPSHTDVDKAQEAEERGGHKRSMILGNQAADNEAKSGMTYHHINWDEHRHADDKCFLATVIQLLIKDIWERHFTTDMEAKHGLELNLQEDDKPVGYVDQETCHEESPEIEEPPDPWEAEQEAADWLAGQDESGNAGGDTSCKPGTAATSAQPTSTAPDTHGIQRSASESPLWIPGYAWH